ncbi:hypothetical protein GALMADRAFT_223733 [Galerina marginata CBS 339.88]|uniref:Uncharacterized protein n=1 Tax=Galerina marginata (strain CBS 339.88) TaxID=685588 RepID=A0A067T8X1_GALM3|nr:hypothetical protein GALMADRAFT_223733 [Galerina marginata CBS 339.88]
MQHAFSPVLSSSQSPSQATQATSVNPNLTTAQRRGITLPPITSPSLIHSPTQTLSTRSVDINVRSRSSLLLRKRAGSALSLRSKASTGASFGMGISDISLTTALKFSPPRKKSRTRAVSAFGFGKMLTKVKGVGLRTIGGMGAGLGGAIGIRKLEKKNENWSEEERLVRPSDTWSVDGIGRHIGYLYEGHGFMSSNLDSPLHAQFASYHAFDEGQDGGVDDPFRTPLGSASMQVDNVPGSPPLSILTNSPEGSWRRGGMAFNLGKAEFSRHKVGKVLGDEAGNEYARLLVLGKGTDAV